MKSFVRAGVAALVSGFVLAGCGSTPGVSNAPDSPPNSIVSSDESSPSPSEAATNPSSSEAETPQPAHVGDAITLKGNADGSQATVVVKKIVDPTRSTDGFTKPSAGMRFVAVQFSVTNSGTVAYDDSPSNGAKVSDADGQQFTPALVMSVKAGPLLPASVKLTPGRKAVGYVVFEIPTASEVAAVQFGMDSGFGETGEWLVK